jgi:hypothetical protein
MIAEGCAYPFVHPAAHPTIADQTSPHYAEALGPSGE